MLAQLPVALTLALLAYVILRARPRDAANRTLAAYLALVAANYVLVGLYSASVRPAAFEGQPDAVRALLMAATVLAVLDPAVLVRFALTYPRPAATRRAWTLLAAGIGSAFAAGILIAPDAFLAQYSAGRLMIEAYVTVAYVGVLGRMAWREFRARETPALPFGLLVAWGVVVLARVGPALDPAVRLVQLGILRPEQVTHGLHVASLLLNCAVSLGATAVFWLVARAFAAPGMRPAADRLTRSVALWILGIAGVLSFPHVIAVALDAPPNGGDGVLGVALAFGTASMFSVRWFAFAFLAGPAFLRNQVFDLDVRARRVLVAGSAAGILLVVFLVAMALLEERLMTDRGVGLDTLLAIGFLLLAASQCARWGRRIADRVFPPAEARLEELRRVRRYEVYRDAARAAAAGNLPAEDLDVLAARLGLAEGERRAALASAAPGTRRPVSPGEVVADRYEVRRLIGQGGHGRVFEAFDRREGRRVALKELDVSDGTQLALVEREVLAGTKLEHRNVARALDFVATAGFTGVVSELVDGASLADHLRANGPLAGERAREVLADVLDGLAFAHARGIVHRDVKPGNVLLGADRRARVADFGIAFVADADATAIGFAPLSGTRAYLPPEAFSGAAPTPAWDVFAAARMFVDAIGGAPALAKLADDERKVIERALAADPRERFNDATTFRAALG